MLKYILKRILLAIVTIWAVATPDLFPDEHGSRWTVPFRKGHQSSGNSRLGGEIWIGQAIVATVPDLYGRRQSR